MEGIASKTTSVRWFESPSFISTGMNKTYSLILYIQSTHISISSTLCAYKNRYLPIANTNMSIKPTYLVAPHFKLITAVTDSFPNILKLSMPKYIV